MFDAELQIVDSQVVDVSENAEQLSSSVASDVLVIGKAGLVKGLMFVVAIEAVTAAAAGANVIPVKFVLQVSQDGGTTYADLATIQLNTAASLAKLGVWGCPIGPLDQREDVKADEDAQVRVAVRYTDNAETDNFTYSAYLATGGPYRQNDLPD